MTAYYNEFDPQAAAWLRELIAKGLIAPGDVDERSITDVKPDDLKGYAQCHFFAGIGGWSHALRLAGIPDDYPVWTGSCPCQPFSSAGTRPGYDDERNLWWSWHFLIQQCRPAILFGEQVASKDGLHWWFDLVQADLEASGYSTAAADLCAAGVGAPHIRQRLYFTGLADGHRPRPQGRRGMPECADQRPVGSSGLVSGLADNNGDGREPRSRRGSVQTERDAEHGVGAVGMGNTDGQDVRGEPGSGDSAQGGAGHRVQGDTVGAPDRIPTGSPAAGATEGFWGNPDWLFCRDDKWRPVEPGTFPLADGVSERVGLLRGYGNAIVPQVAQAFIEAVMEC